MYVQDICIIYYFNSVQLRSYVAAGVPVSKIPSSCKLITITLCSYIIVKVRMILPVINIVAVIMFVDMNFSC